MTVTSSGTTITQTGTDTGLAVLNGLAGITTSTQGFYTRYALTSTYDIIVNGTWTIGTGATFQQLFIAPSTTAKNIIRVNGTLNIGSSEASPFSQVKNLNTPIILQEQALLATQNPGNLNDGAGGGVQTTFYCAPGSTINIFGHEINLTGHFGFSSTSIVNMVDATLRGESIYIHSSNATLTRTAWFCARTTTDAQLFLLHPSINISGLEVYRTNGYVAFSASSVEGGLYSVRGIPVLPASISLVGTGFGTSTANPPVGRFFNLAGGSDYQFAIQGGSRWYTARLLQEVSVVTRNTSGQNIPNALVRITGKAGSTVYSVVSDSNGLTPIANVELMRVDRASSTVTLTRYSASDSIADDFNVVIYSYGHLFAELPVQTFKSINPVTINWTLFTDTGVTQTNSTTVAAYTGIAVSATEITISEARSLAEVYDFTKLAWRNNQFANRPIRNGTQADFGAFNLVINAALSSSTGTFLDGFTLTGNLTFGASGSYPGKLTKSGGNTILQSARTYAFAGTFTGGTITVEPGATSLANCVFSGTTINVSSGNATVTIAESQASNVIAGSGVTIVLVLPQITIPNFANGTRLYVARTQALGFTAANVNTTTSEITLTGNIAQVNDVVWFQGADLPAPLAEGLYIVTQAGAAIRIRRTSGVSPIAFTDAGSGSMSATIFCSLINTVVGAGGFSQSLQLPNNATLQVRAQHYDRSTLPAKASVYFERNLTWNSTSGATISDTIDATTTPDLDHNTITAATAYADDGNLITGVTFDGTGEVFVDASVRPTIATQEAYIRMVSDRATTNGIGYIGNNFRGDTEGANFRFYGNLTINNTAVGSILRIIGAPFKRSDNASWVAAGSNTVYAEFAIGVAAYSFNTGGGSGPTAIEIRQEIDTNSTRLAALNTRSLRLDALIENSSGDRFTPKALEAAPAGGGGTADWTATERNQIRHRLGIDGTVATPSATPSLATASAVLAIPTNPLLATSYTAPDNAGISTLLTRLTATRAGNLDSIPGLSTFNPGTQTVTVGTNNDKSGYSLSAAGNQAIFSLTTAAQTTAGTIGRLIVDNLNAPIGSIPTNPLLAGSYTAPDNAGITTLLSRLTATRAGHLDAIPGLSTFNPGSQTVTVGTNNDKTGYALTAGERSAIAASVDTQLADNFAALPTAPSVADIWGYSGTIAANVLTQVRDSNWSAGTRTLTAFGFSVAVSDKTGFELAVEERGAIATAVDSALADNFAAIPTTPLLSSDPRLNNLATIATLPTLSAIEGSTVLARQATLNTTLTAVLAIPTNPLLATSYTAPNNAGVTTLLDRLTATRAGYLDAIPGLPNLAAIEGSTVLAKVSNLNPIAANVQDLIDLRGFNAALPLVVDKADGTIQAGTKIVTRSETGDIITYTRSNA